MTIGKLMPDDEGELAMMIGTHKGKVILDFGGPVTWMAMDPAQARGLAEILIKRSQEADDHPDQIGLGT